MFPQAFNVTNFKADRLPGVKGAVYRKEFAIREDIPRRKSTGLFPGIFGLA
jgi:hypothetical protein